MNEISQEDMKFLTELSKEMNTQDKRCTAYPLFVIQIDKKEYGAEEWCNETERRDDTDGVMCETCIEKENKDIELLDYCYDCDDECFVWYNVAQTFDMNAGCFFTAKECEEHIRLNHYHYANPKSYAIGAWRNPEMERVMQIISRLTTDDKNLLG